MRFPRIFFAALVLLLPCVSSADEHPQSADALQKQLAAFLAETDAEKRAAAGLLIAVRWPDARKVAEAIPAARRWPADAAKDEIVTWKRSTADGVAHTVYANIPVSYDAKKSWPVLVWLHGGVSRQADNGGLSGIRYLSEISDEDGFLLLSPSTQAGSEWWTPNGAALVRGALDDLKRRYRVDADRVAVGGFSDGASGCFHLLAHDPEPYCCFLALMPHPGVTRLAGGPSFAANVRSRPVYAVNGGKDPLYASVRVRPMIAELKKAGCDITWVDKPEAGHRITDVLPDDWEKLRGFWHAHPRQASPRQIAWETAVPAREGRFGWVEVLAVDEKAPSAKGAKAAVLPDPAGRPRLGVRIDREPTAEGLRVNHVEPDSAAADAGFEVGDVLTGVDGKDLGGQNGRMVLMLALAAMKDREGVFKVKRGEQELELKAQPRATGAGRVKRSKDRGYGLPSGRIEARVAEGNRIDITTRHVARLKLHLASGPLDLSKPVRIFVNGELKHEGPLTGTTGYVLQEAVRGGPGAPLYSASIVLRP